MKKNQLIIVIMGIIIVGLLGVLAWQTYSPVIPQNTQTRDKNVTNPPPLITPAQSPTTETLPRIDISKSAENLFAQSLITLQPEQVFSISVPKLKFKIHKVTKATGGVLIEKWCNAPSIFYKYRTGSPPGYCFDTNAKINGVEPSVVAVELLVTNNQAQSVRGQLIDSKLAYEREADGERVTRVAHAGPLSFLSYYFEGFADQDISLSFQIPSDQDEVRLSFGYFGPDTKYGEKDYVINFRNKTFEELPG